MSSSLPAKVALITGGAQGIGAAIALKLASDGFDIAVADLSSKSSLLDGVAKQVKAKGQRACTIFVDVTQDEQVKKMVEKCVEVLGRLDVVRPLTYLCKPFLA